MKPKPSFFIAFCISTFISHHISYASFTLPVSRQDKVLVLDDSTFDQTIKGGEWLVEFYAEWCPACQQFKEDYKDLAELASREAPRLKLAKVNMDENPILTARFLVSRLPSLFYINDLKGQKEVRALNTIKVGTLADYIIRKSWDTAASPKNSFIGPFSVIGWIFGYAGYFGHELTDVTKWLQGIGVPNWLIIIFGLMLFAPVTYMIVFLPIPGLSPSRRHAQLDHKHRNHENDKLDEDDEDSEEDDLNEVESLAAEKKDKKADR